MDIKKCILCGVLLSISEMENNLLGKIDGCEFYACDVHYKFLKMYAGLIRNHKI
jgi:hypothetical protein